MIDLAANGGRDIPVFLSEIARRQGVSEKYLEHIFSALLKGGVVKAQRGRKGGYLLNRTPEEITLSQIVTVLEGPCSLVDCVANKGSCPKADDCASREVWATLGHKIEEVLSGYTLASLVQMQQLKNQKDSMMYYI